jgi:hypothetical protein
MGRLTFDPGDSMDDTLRATYASDRGWSYRLLASLDYLGAWRIYPDAFGDLAWLGTWWPGYLAIPGQDCYGFAVYRAAEEGQPSGEPVGYATNLGDACRPAEHDLIKVRHETGAGQSGAGLA